MAVTYKCDNCDVTATSLEGWLLVAVGFLHHDPAAPNPPGGRVLDATAADLYFHSTTCRDAWAAKAGLVAPAPAGGG